MLRIRLPIELSEEGLDPTCDFGTTSQAGSLVVTGQQPIGNAALRLIISTSTPLASLGMLL
jgi:hypothetical protein